MLAHQRHIYWLIFCTSCIWLHRAEKVQHHTHRNIFLCKKMNTQIKTIPFWQMYTSHAHTEQTRPKSVSLMCSLLFTHQWQNLSLTCSWLLTHEWQNLFHWCAVSCSYINDKTCLTDVQLAVHIWMTKPVSLTCSWLFTYEWQNMSHWCAVSCPHINDKTCLTDVQLVVHTLMTKPVLLLCNYLFTH